MRARHRSQFRSINNGSTTKRYHSVTFFGHVHFCREVDTTSRWILTRQVKAWRMPSGSKGRQNTGHMTGFHQTLICYQQRVFNVKLF